MKRRNSAARAWAIKHIGHGMADHPLSPAEAQLARTMAREGKPDLRIAAVLRRPVWMIRNALDDETKP